MIIDSGIVTGSLTVSGSFNQQGNTFISGNLIVSGVVNAVVSGSINTASYAETARSSSYAVIATSSSYANIATSSSYSLTTTSSSFANNASTATSASYANVSTSGSYAATSSYASAFNVAGTLTATTLVVNTVSSSVTYSSGSNVFGNSLSNTQVMTGSVGITGSLAVNETPAVLGSGTTGYVPKLTASSTLGNSLIYDNGTNVGIGTTSPGVSLDVSGSGIRIINPTSPNVYLNNTTVQWKFYLNGNNYAINDTVRDVLVLGYNGAASYFSGGNVGIGTSSPSVKLEVSGSSEVLRLRTSNTDNYIAFFNSAGSQAGDIGYDSRDTNGLSIWNNNADGNLVFGAGAARRMTLTSSGNLGLGVTPSAFSGIVGLQLPTYGAVTFVADGHIASNAYYNAGWKYVNATGGATLYNHSNGSHLWQIAGASGGAGTAISFTQAMTLDASGNLLVGNTTSSSTTTPINISLGGTYGTTLSNGTKVKIYDSGGIAHGIGAIAGNLYLNTADSLTYITFNTNNSEKVRINNGGNVSIGNTNDTYKLDVSGTGRFTATANTYGGGSLVLRSTDTTTNTYLTTVPNLFALSVGGSADHLLITSTGAATFSSSVTATSYYNLASGFIRFYNANNTNWGTISGNTGTTFGTLSLTGGSGNGMFIDNGGNVGIGTTSPSAKLQIVTDAVAGKQNLGSINKATNNWLRISNPYYSTDASVGVLLRVFPDSDSRQGAGIIASGGANNNSTELDLFYSNISGTCLSGLKLDSYGNVGIGTTSPSNLLSLVQSTSGNIMYVGQGPTNQSSLNALIALQSGTIPQSGGDTTGEAGFIFNHSYGTGGVNGTANGGYIKSIRESVFGTTSQVNTALIFATTTANTNNERIRITSSGNVGIGTTAPAANLVVVNTSGTSIPSLGSSGGHFQLQNGTYGLSAGVSGAGYTWMQAARTDGTATAYNLLLQPNGGNVGIGTTSPNGKLHVQGTGAVLTAQSTDDEVPARIVNLSNSISTTGFQANGSTNSFNVRIGCNVNDFVAYTSNTERMRITSSGNILLGSTTDYAGLLQVNGQLSVIRSSGYGYLWYSNNTANNQYLFHQIPSSDVFLIGTGKNGTSNQPALAFGTVDSERMRITSGGNVLIGTTTESSESNLSLGAKGTNEGGQICLNKSTSYTYAAHLDVWNDSFRVLYGTNSATSGVRMAIDLSNGNTTISNLSGTGSRTVTADASGVLSASSDSRLKIEDTTYKIQGLNEILQLQPRAYKWKKDIEERGEQAVTEIGFFADEVNPIIPSAAPIGQDGMYGLYDRSIIAALVNSVQQQQTQIDALKAELNTLKDILQRNNIT